MKRYKNLFTESPANLKKLKTLLNKLGVSYNIEETSKEVSVTLIDNASMREIERVKAEVYTLFSDRKIDNKSLFIRG